VESQAKMVELLAKRDADKVSQFTVVELTKAQNECMRLGYDCSNSNVPYFTQITLAVKCVQNFDVASNSYKPLLPAEPNLQPAELKRRAGALGNVLEVEEVQQFAFSDGALTSRVHVSSASKGRDRSVWDVAQGYILYWHMVLILSVLIPAGTLCLDYAVDVAGMFVRPYKVSRFCNLLVSIRAGNLLTGEALDGLLVPLMVFVQEKTNRPDIEGGAWSGDMCLNYLYSELTRNMSVTIASAAQTRGERKPVLPPQVQVRQPPQPNAPRPQRQPPQPNAPRPQQPPKVKQAPLPKCLKCDHQSGHASGICSKCRFPDGRGFLGQRRGDAASARGSGGGAVGGAAAAPNP
jgi:hypothetical protein